MSEEARQRAAQEMVYCEQILAKSGTGILLRTLPAQGLVTWKHYPEKDVYDAASGAQWYYHCHDDSATLGEHGHFHCFVRPDGKDSPACHLIAVGVDGNGRLKRLFTVNQWVTGSQWFDAATTNPLLERFNVELATPDYLVNRWLTAVLTRYEPEIITLNLSRDEALRATGKPLSEVLEDRSLEVLSELVL
ncbi:hypothetical protein FPY71_13995 [Aureimonas fodinaquatilis]|uniref:DUF6969 domain-containing protein n=1 Tax=Aureimonas fodinaquatilis TaxID=2565783 RepID=A0A5B0DVN8_9HYPH|nr:hypothetical protein [Aureimonas fodinaquatilis]KAA0969630.1 hypothetical protein FPY71_13995 [Aureimonas fodinaquatilis]